MDNFMERITSRFSSTDIIKANQQADAAQLDSAKEQIVLFENQMVKVDNALSDLRQVNLKNIESAQDIQNMTRESANKITAAVNNVESESVRSIKETSDLSIASINKTVEDALSKINEIKESADSIDAIKESVTVITEKIDSLRREIEEYSHADHVKIYRNVQASFVEELTKQSSEIKDTTKKKGVMLPLMIITMLVSIASLTITILNMIGML